MKRIKQLLNQARKIIGNQPRNFKELYIEKAQKKVRAVMQDPHHPLHTEFKTLQSGHRLQMPRCRTERDSHLSHVQYTFLTCKQLRNVILTHCKYMYHLSHN